MSRDSSDEDQGQTTKKLKASWFPLLVPLITEYTKSEALLLSWLLNRGYCMQRKIEKRIKKGEDVQQTSWIPCDGPSIHKSLPIFSSNQICMNVINKLKTKKIIKSEKMEERMHVGNGYHVGTKVRKIKININKVIRICNKAYCLSKKRVAESKDPRYIAMLNEMNFINGKPLYVKVFFPLMHKWKNADKIIFFHWMFNACRNGRYWLSVDLVKAYTGLDKKTQLVMLKEFESEKLIKIEYERFGMLSNRYVSMRYKNIAKLVDLMHNTDNIPAD